jgi:hypothetical protein
MHRCRRVYTNGDTALEGRLDRVSQSPSLQGWLGYNRLYRPGCTLLVDGKVDTLGIGFTESDRQRLETQYADDAQPGPCQGGGG